MSSIQDRQREDMLRLRRMLENVLPVSPPASSSGTRILDVACGACSEADLLTDFFGKIRGGDANLTGIDMRAREIAQAQQRFGKGRALDPDGRTHKTFEFLTGDATKLEQHGELGEDFDIVFMRHQNYWNGQRTWEEIFDQALKKLGPDGELVITSYFDHEHVLALKALQNLGAELLVTQQNDHSRMLTTPGKSVDRHVAVFRRKH